MKTCLYALAKKPAWAGLPYLFRKKTLNLYRIPVLTARYYLFSPIKL